MIKPQFSSVLKAYKKRLLNLSYFIRGMGFQESIKDINQMLISELWTIYSSTNKSMELGHFLKRIINVALVETVKNLYIENGYVKNWKEHKWIKFIENLDNINAYLNGFCNNQLEHLGYEDLLKPYRFHKDNQNIFVLYLKGYQYKDIQDLFPELEMKDIRYIIQKCKTKIREKVKKDGGIRKREFQSIKTGV